MESRKCRPYIATNNDTSGSITINQEMIAMITGKIEEKNRGVSEDTGGRLGGRMSMNDW